MADFERSTTVGVGADAAFAFLSDPRRLPDYVAGVTLVDSIAVDGDPAADAETAGRDAAPEARFFADAATRRVEWGLPGSDYHGSFEIAEGTIANTSQVTIRLHVGGAADPAPIEPAFTQTVRNLQRLLSGR